MTIVLIDADHFKSVNDERGAPRGRRGAARDRAGLAANAKGFDVVARVGGDEFGVVLPACSAEQGAEIAERLRAAVTDEPGESPVTVSAGWATFPDHGADRRALLSAADAALYEAKHAEGPALDRPRTSDGDVSSLPSAG